MPTRGSNRSPISQATACCLYAALIPCLLLSFSGIAILTSVTGVRIWSAKWSSITLPVTFDTRTEEAIAKLDLAKSMTPSHSDGELVPYLMSGDLVDIGIQLFVNRGDHRADVFNVETTLYTHDGQELGSVLILVSWPTQTRIARILHCVVSPSKLLAYLQGQDVIDIVLVERYQETESTPLTAVKTVLTARHGGELPVIHEASMSLSRHLGWIGRVFYVLRPSDMASYVWIGGSLMLIVVPALMALAIVTLIKLLTAEKKPVSGGVGANMATAAAIPLPAVSDAPATPKKRLRHRAPAGTS